MVGRDKKRKTTLKHIKVSITILHVSLERSQRDKLNHIKKNHQRYLGAPHLPPKGGERVALLFL